MTQTTSSVLSSLITFDVQNRVLDNLRSNLLYANRDWAEQGTLMPGTDTARFVFIPDLAVPSGNLTEGVTPTAVALSESHVDVSTEQIGNIVDISDVAKVKSPVALVAEAAERISRNAQETIDKRTRDAIATGGTAFYAGSGNTDRDGLEATDVLKASELRKIRAKLVKAKVSPFPDRYYRLIVTADQGYDIRNDSTSPGGFIDVNRYKNPGVLLAGELGQLEGFRIMESQNGPTFTNSGSVTVHAAIAFGAQKGWGVADLQSLIVRHAAPGGHDDLLEQSELLGWKVNFGVATLANARYIRAESGVTAL